MLMIYFDNVLIDEDAYAELTNEYKLFNDSFYLGSTASNTFNLKVLKSAISSHPSEVLIDDGITTFPLVVDKVEEDKGFYNYSLTDKMVNFNFNYDASVIIAEKEALGEDCYLSDIWHDMCSQAGVDYDETYIFLNDIVVNWYDSRIQARDYLSFIAELEGGYACIDELGKLTIKPHKKASSKEISVDEVSELIIGEKKTISRVVFDNGIVKWEFGDETGNTLYLNPNNVFITDENVVENIYDKIVGFEFYSITVPNTLIDSSIKAGDVITFVDGDNEYPTIAQYSSSYAGGWVGSYDFNINTAKQEETKILGIEENILSIKTEVDRTNASLKITAEKTDEATSKIATLETTASEITLSVSDMNIDINNNYVTNDSLSEQIQTSKNEITTELETKLNVNSEQLAIQIMQNITTNGISKLKNLLVDIDIEGIKVAVNTNAFNTLLNNIGLYCKDGNTIIAQIDKDGAILRNPKLQGQIIEHDLFLKETLFDETFGEGQATFWIGG